MRNKLNLRRRTTLGLLLGGVLVLAAGQVLVARDAKLKARRAIPFSMLI